MIKRDIKPSKLRSFFLFGARGTGKTTFLESFFEGDKHFTIDLLNPEWEERLSANPDLLNEILEASVVKKKIKFVIIDEIQKIPKLLDIVHSQIEKNKLCFALTGSSARKLKKNVSVLFHVG
jgi:predicted AAA+ superfamily ATPase